MRNICTNICKLVLVLEIIETWKFLLCYPKYLDLQSFNNYTRNNRINIKQINKTICNSEFRCSQWGSLIMNNTFTLYCSKYIYSPQGSRESKENAKGIRYLIAATMLLRLQVFIEMCSVELSFALSLFRFSSTSINNWWPVG